MSESTQLATQSRPLVKASSELSAFLGMEVSTMIDTIKAQCFKGKRPEEVTDAQLATYVSVANTLKLNPLLPGMMYPYPDRNGSVTVIIGPDGVFTLLASNPDIVAGAEGGPAWWTEHGKDSDGKDTCTAFINHRVKGLLTKTIWVDEWVVSSNPNWNTRRHHQSEIRALKQCARQLIHGIPMDEDEVSIAGLMNVTGTGDGDAPPESEKLRRPASPPREVRGVAAATAAKKTEAIEVAATEPPAAKELEPEALQDTGADQAQQEQPPEPPTAKKSEPRKPVKEPAAPQPVTSLAVGQRVTFEGLEIERFVKKPINNKPSVEAALKGAFTGTVYHLGGAEDPAWQIEKPVNAVLRGQKLKSGPVITLVDSLEVSAEAAGLTLE